MSLQPGGLMALLDAAEMVLHEMKKARNPRKAILIIAATTTAGILQARSNPLCVRRTCSSTRWASLSLPFLSG
jgi:hypothetical protein